MSGIYAELLRMKLADPDPSPGWTNPDPYAGETHYLIDRESKPACGLQLHYDGPRSTEPPVGVKACEGCAHRAHAR
jgi:hypothetical protein